MESWAKFTESVDTPAPEPRPFSLGTLCRRGGDRANPPLTLLHPRAVAWECGKTQPDWREGDVGKEREKKTPPSLHQPLCISRSFTHNILLYRPKETYSPEHEHSLVALKWQSTDETITKHSPCHCFFKKLGDGAGEM